MKKQIPNWSSGDIQLIYSLGLNDGFKQCEGDKMDGEYTTCIMFIDK